jgi:DNA-binding NarL/FixJ family response regulator
MGKVCVLLVEAKNSDLNAMVSVLELSSEIQFVRVTEELINRELMVELQPALAIIEFNYDIRANEQILKTFLNFPEIKLVVVSSTESENCMWMALQMGAKSYVLKTSASTELELAIQYTLQGQTFLSPAVAKYAISHYFERVPTMPGPSGHLTPRQRQIIVMLTNGYTNRQLAQELKISVKTAEAYRSQVMGQLDIHDITGLVRYAVNVGLVES